MIKNVQIYLILINNKIIADDAQQSFSIAATWILVSLFYWHLHRAAALPAFVWNDKFVTLFIFSQMKAVAGMKMSYNLQQAIDLSRRTIIRGFRQDETHSALCSHLFTMIRGNRQHRRAFLISLLNLFDDSAVSKLTVISTHLGSV